METYRRLGKAFWIESATALASATLLAVTLITRTWVEKIFKVDPDQGSGSLEWIIIGVALMVTVASVTLAGSEWRSRRAVAVT
ncbi:MAG: ABC transporter permease [Chloroflexota bacterium]|nr:ABC transporter permease [Chloroflexota bacterium]